MVLYRIIIIIIADTTRRCMLSFSYVKAQGVVVVGVGVGVGVEFATHSRRWLIMVGVVGI